MRPILTLTLLVTAVTVLGGDLVVPFELHRDQKVVLIKALVGGREVVLIVDTGTPATMLAPDAAGIVSPAQRSRFAEHGLRADGRWAVVELRIGSVQWRRRSVGVIDFSEVRKIYGRNVDGVLGQDVLSEFDAFRIDFKARTMTLTR